MSQSLFGSPIPYLVLFGFYGQHGVTSEIPLNEFIMNLSRDTA
jgi:hypothetical protein